jgi:hypothetical protein
MGWSAVMFLLPDVLDMEVFGGLGPSLHPYYIFTACPALGVGRREDTLRNYRVVSDRPFMEYKTARMLKQTSNTVEYARRASGIFKSEYHGQGHDAHVPLKYASPPFWGGHLQR